MADTNDLEKKLEAKKKALLYEMVGLGSLMFPAFEYAQNGKITVLDVIFTVVILIVVIGLVSRINRRTDKPEKENLNNHPISEKSI
jgi:uncharacterized membrane protein